MAKITGPDGALKDASDKELEMMRQTCLKKAKEQAIARLAAKEDQAKEIRGETMLLDQAWKERLEFLAQKRDLKRVGKTEDDDEVQNVSLEIDVRDIEISSYCQDLDVFSEWIKLLIARNQRENGEDEDNDELKRAYGYCARFLAEKMLKVAKKPTPIEKKEIADNFKTYGRPPQGQQVVTYKGEYLVPTQPEDPLQKKVFYWLEAMRRATRVVKTNQASEEKQGREEN